MSDLTDPAIRIANAFAIRLKKEIGEDKFKAVLEANRTEANPEICHSHDFVDANVLMDEAFKEVLGVLATSTGTGGKLMNAKADALWAAAWTIFRRGRAML